jgi:hypothetical protein
MITLYVSLGCLVGGILMGYSWRAREEAALKEVVKVALTEWHNTKNTIMGVGSQIATGLKKL